jgi:hypothetical protein
MMPSVPEPAARGAVSRLFHTFANAMLERTLPRLRDWLRGRFGEGAQLDGMELDGATIRLRGAVLPLGDTIRLDVDDASFRVRPDALGDRAPIRLDTLRGTLRVPHPDGPLFEAHIELESEPRDSVVGGVSPRPLPRDRQSRTALPPQGARFAREVDPWVRGVLHVRDARWRTTHGEGGAAPMSGVVKVEVTTDAWSLGDGELRAADARVSLDARGLLGDGERRLTHARIVATDARAGHYVDALLALAGQIRHIAVPFVFASTLDGELRFDADEGVHADLALRTSTSSLRLKADVTAASPALAQATLEGTLGWADLWPEGLPALDPAPPALALSATLSGAIDRAALDARVGWGSEAQVTVRGTAGSEAIALAVEGSVSPNAFAPILASRARVESDAPLVVRGTMEGAPSSLETRLWITCAELLGHTATRGRPFAIRALEARAERTTETTVHVVARLGDGSAELAMQAGAPARLELASLDPEGVVALFDLAGMGHVMSAKDEEPAAWMRLPPDTRAGATITKDGDAVTGRLEVTTPRTSLALDPLSVSLSDGAFDGSRLSGHLAFEDGLTLGWFPADVRPQRLGRVTGTLLLCGAGARFVMEGPVQSASMGLISASRPHVPPVVLSELEGTLAIRADGMAVSGLRGRAFGGPITIDGGFPWGGAPVPDGPDWLRLRLGGLSKGLCGWSNAALGLDGTLPELTLDGEVRWTSLGRWLGKTRVRAEHSTLAVDLDVSPEGALEGTRVEGELAFSDLAPLLPRGPIAIVRQGTMKIEGRAEGTLDAPGLALEARANAVGVRVGEETSVELVVPLVEVRAHVNRHRALWSDVRGRFYGGIVRSQGVFGWSGEGFRGVQATLAVSDAKIDRVPTPDGRRMGEHVEGLLSGQLELRRKSLDEPFTARGAVTLESASYPVLARAAGPLGRYGLDPPDPVGRGPLSANVRYRGERWELSELSVATASGALRGRVLVHTDGRLAGETHVVVNERYLRSSPLLEIPAVIAGDVRIPVSLGGTLASPRTDADLVGALDDLLGASRIGRNVASAFEALVDEIAGSPPPRRAYPASPPRRSTVKTQNIDALLDHLVDEDEEYDQSLDFLLDKGLSPDTIAELIEKRRAARQR